MSVRLYSRPDLRCDRSDAGLHLCRAWLNHDVVVGVRATRHWSFPSERLEEFDQCEFVGIAQARLLGKLIGAKIMSAVDDIVWTGAKPIEFPSHPSEDARRRRVISVGRHRR